jgi:hypothetical protein
MNVVFIVAALQKGEARSRNALAAGISRYARRAG